MFLKYRILKTKGGKNISGSTERLFGNDVTNQEQELDEQMYNLSLTTSSQPQIKQDIDDKMSMKGMQMLNETENKYKTPLTPDYVDYFQHDFSKQNQSSRYNQRGIHQKCINQSVAQLRRVFSWRRGQQTFSSGDLNHSFNFEPYQQDLSMQCHPQNQRVSNNPKSNHVKKSRRYSIQFHHRFFKGRYALNHSHESTLLLSRESQI